jgi:glyceraldehyde 3-phosphate dehydrogenase
MAKLNLAINGFGRIGRTFLKSSLLDKEFNNIIEVKAINDLTNLKELSHLFKYDSTFGKFEGDIEIDETEKMLIINKEKRINIISERDPSKLPWKNLNIFFVLESTGKFNDNENAQKHLLSGAKKVIISALPKIQM